MHTFLTLVCNPKLISLYRVVTKPIKRMADGNIKANMDMEIAMEVLDQAPYLDEIVLITGDGDFTSLVNRLVQRGKFVSVIGPDRFTAPELIQACHAFLNFSQIPGALEPRSNEGGRNGSGQQKSQSALLSCGFKSRRLHECNKKLLLVSWENLRR